MALLTVEGVYKDGKVELSEMPGVVESPARVIVTFLPAHAQPSEEVDREESRRRAIARMKEGLNLGGAPYPGREEIHDRFGFGR